MEISPKDWNVFWALEGYSVQVQQLYVLVVTLATKMHDAGKAAETASCFFIVYSPFFQKDSPGFIWTGGMPSRKAAFPARFSFECGYQEADDQLWVDFWTSLQGLKKQGGAHLDFFFPFAFFFLEFGSILQHLMTLRLAVMFKGDQSREIKKAQIDACSL